MSSRVPYVFVLDLDGTVWGDVRYQSSAHSLCNVIKKLGFKPKKNYVVPPAFTPKSKLIRPGLVSFMKTLNDHFNGNVCFFVYTASDRAWALQEIAWVEKTFNIQFAKPIFTRDDCTMDQGSTYRKSIGRIFPRICRSINRMRGSPLTKEERMYILENQIICIDNNAVYTDRTDKLLLCPDYDYVMFENLLDYIPSEAMSHPGIQHTILTLINNGMICPMPNQQDDHMKQMAKSYGWLSAKCKAYADINKAYLGDDFWKYLGKLIVQNDLRRFNNNIIHQLQEGIWKHFKAKSKS